MARDRELLEVRVLLATALVADGRASDAARLLAALPAETRAKTPIAGALARALATSGDLASAAQAWEDARRANPADAVVRAEAAIALLRAGDRARAAALLDGFESLVDGVRERRRVEEEIRAAAPVR
jgi:Flp pilus assembly protein TadD